VRDAPIDGLIRKMLSARTQESSECCVDENLMAAYLEASLSPKEMAEFESHVSDCAICRETLALAIGLGNREEAGRPVIATEPRKARSRFFRFVPVAGVLILAIALIPVISKLAHKQAEKPPQNQVAELHMAAKPVQKTEIAEQTAKSEPIKPKTAEVIRIQSLSEKKTLEKQVFEDKKEKAPLTAALLKGAEPVPAVPPIEKDADLPSKSAQDERTDESTQGYKLAAAAPTPRIPLSQIDVSRYSALNSVPPIVSSNSLPPTSMMLGSDKSATEFKKIGDKEFYLNSGIWIDRQCAEHRDSLVIEVLPVVPEHEAILKQYPDLRNLLPAMVYWNGKIYLLR
jgi:hypothetical protein